MYNKRVMIPVINISESTTFGGPRGLKRNLVAAAASALATVEFSWISSKARERKKSLKNLSQKNVNEWDGVDFTRNKKLVARKASYLPRALRV